MYEIFLIVTMLINISVDFIDRSVATKGGPMMRDSIALWSVIIQFILILPLAGLVSGISLLPLILCALVGATSALGRSAWYEALAVDHQTLSRLTPFVRLSSLIVLLAAYLLLKEPLSAAKLGGGVIMILASLLITLDRPVESIREFIKYNRPASLTLFFAISVASISVLYKYLLNDGIDIFSTFFYLKLFQCCILIPVVIERQSLYTNFRQVAALRVVVFGRVLQTIAAFIYLFVLRNLHLSTVEPIAALSPIFVLCIEFVVNKMSGHPPTEDNRANGTRLIAIRAIALIMTGAGAVLLLTGE